MKKKYVLIIAIICFNFNPCLAQNSAKFTDKYIMVIDVQSKFSRMNQTDSAADAFMRNVNSVINQSDPEKVIYVKAASRILTISLKGSSVDTTYPELDSNLSIVSSNIFTKYKGDAFTVPDLREFLESNNVKEIILIGLMAEECVYSTAKGGKNRGYEIYIIPEATIGKSNKKKEKAIEKMGKKGIKILELKE